MTAMGIISEQPLTDELLEQVIATLKGIDPNRSESEFIGLKKNTGKQYWRQISAGVFLAWGRSRALAGGDKGRHKVGVLGFIRQRAKV